MSARGAGRGPAPGSAFTRWWINHPGLDYVVAAALLAAVMVLRGGGHHPLRYLDGTGRLLWVGTLAIASALVFGLLLSVGCVVLAVAPGPRLRRVLDQVGDRLTRIVASCLGALAACTGLLAIAMPFYGPHPRRGVGLGLLVVVTVLVQRVGRLLWVYWRVALVFVEDASAAAARPVKSVQPPAEPAAAPAASPSSLVPPTSGGEVTRPTRLRWVARRPG